MALSAPVVNGNVVQKTTQASENTETKKAESSSSLDKEAFLQLLVAQMKYQDPLEPTSNTEYISQFATFSELEEMQNLGDSMDIQRASGLVGQYVTMNVKSEVTGEVTQIGGKVDYVTVEGGKAYLNIKGSAYSIDDLDSVVDETYLNAFNLAADFLGSMAKLPPIGELTTSYKDVLENLRNVYSDMTAYQQGFVNPESIRTLQDYEAKMKDLLTVEGETEEKVDETAETAEA